MRASRWRRTGCLFAAVGLITAAGGCKSVPPPNQQMAAMRAAMHEAIEAGAPEYAGAEFARARQKYQRASALSADREYGQARRLAEEAEVDARLAASKARAVRAGRELSTAEENLRALTQRPTSPADLPR
jgi:hypothetical protein